MGDVDPALTDEEQAVLDKLEPVPLLRAAHRAMVEAAGDDGDDQLYAAEILDVLHRYAGDHVES